jgi:hypothetical protein
VIILKALGDRSAKLEGTGNIDEDAVIDAVIKIMEGGKEAFKERERRYDPISASRVDRPQAFDSGTRSTCM